MRSSPYYLLPVISALLVGMAVPCLAQTTPSQASMARGQGIPPFHPSPFTHGCLVVTRRRTTVLSALGTGSHTLCVLPKGRKLRFFSATMTAYDIVRLPDGRMGWVRWKDIQLAR